MSVRSIGVPNTHTQSSAFIRQYSRVEIQYLSEMKLTKLGVTREQRKQKQQERSDRGKQAFARKQEGIGLNVGQRRQRRERILRRLVQEFGAAYSPRCQYSQAFINERWEEFPWTEDFLGFVLNHMAEGCSC